MNSYAIRFALSCAISLAPSAPASAEERVARVGYLSWSDTGHYEQITSEGFAAGLREEGFVEGKNLVILKRAANFETVRFKEHARELAKVPVDVFFAPATAMASAAWYADRKTPIVIATIIDPVALDFAQSLAHRSEERRVGKECIPPCRSRWSPYH